jgi:rhamnose utilization protein RhaD (predicted bifunctional aldolase and dehydrogenase)
MPERHEILRQLVAMSRSLGDPSEGYVILGEGSTSASAGGDTFFVKASGMQLATAQESSFVEVRVRDTQALLGEKSISDEQIRSRLKAAMVDSESLQRPSVETILLGRALYSGAAEFVGHTHPTILNAILCSRWAEEAFAGRLFPDEIVVCGPAPVYVPYTDPGLPLARAVWTAVERHADLHQQWPRVILLQNHGLIALGQSAQEVVDITAMAVKAAQVLLGTYALGGPRFLPTSDVARLDSRPDEEYRREVLSRTRRGLGAE